MVNKKNIEIGHSRLPEPLYHLSLSNRQNFGYSLIKWESWQPLEFGKISNAKQVYYPVHHINQIVKNGLSPILKSAGFHHISNKDFFQDALHVYLFL